VKSWQGFYDFAVDGGVAGTITLRSNDGPIPNGSYVLGGIVDVATLLTGTGATVAVQVEAANDTVNAAAISGAPWSSTGLKSVIPVFTGATALKATADRSPAIVVAVANLTAGKFTVTLFYR